jgi:hypothetical protein
MLPNRFVIVFDLNHSENLLSPRSGNDNLCNELLALIKNAERTFMSLNAIPIRSIISAEMSKGLCRLGVLILLSLFSMLAMNGCASTKITDREQMVTKQLPRPEHIWIHDFAASPGDIPAYSVLSGQGLESPDDQTSEHVALGRKLGTQIARELVAQIRQMGLPAELAGPQTSPKIDDIVIEGYLVSFNQGNTAKRVTIGLGAGSSELKVAVEGFQMTEHGLRKLGSGSTDATGNKTPGMGVGLLSMLATHNPAGLIISTGMKIYDEKTGKDTVEARAKQTAKEISDVLEKRFKQEGWIQ